MAGLGRVRFVPGRPEVWSGPAVQVETDQPIAACMAAQYAGWEIKADGFFAMGSGPIRAAANREKLFESIGYSERSEVAVGVLETRLLPTTAISAKLAEACGVAPRGTWCCWWPRRPARRRCANCGPQRRDNVAQAFRVGFRSERVVSGYGTAHAAAGGPG